MLILSFNNTEDFILLRVTQCFLCGTPCNFSDFQLHRGTQRIQRVPQSIRKNNTKKSISPTDLKSIIQDAKYSFFSLILLFHSNLFAQDDPDFVGAGLQKQYELAHNFFNQEKYFDAITEFRRLLFFDKDSIYTFDANELIGQSYKMGGKFSEAITHFTLAELNAHNEENEFRIKTEMARVNILRRTTSRGLQILDEIRKNNLDSSKRDEINYWRGWAYIFADEWDKAAESFSQISPDHELKLLSEKIEDEKYSVTLAKIMSHILPGAGQFYTGNYLSGLISLGWNFLWGFITVNSFTEERIFDGFAVGSLLWLRFYRGNTENAEKFAKEKNLKIVNKALYYLQHDYNGLKP